MYIIGELDVAKIGDFAAPGEKWKDGDFALLLRMLGDGQRVFAEVLRDINNYEDQGWEIGALVEIKQFMFDSDEVRFLDDGDECSYRTEAFRIVRPTEDIRGRRVLKPMKHVGGRRWIMR